MLKYINYRNDEIKEILIDDALNTFILKNGILSGYQLTELSGNIKFFSHLGTYGPRAGNPEYFPEISV